MKKLRIFIGILISAVFLFLAFRKVNLREILNFILSANLFYIFLTSTIMVIYLIARSERWRILLRQALYSTTQNSNKSIPLRSFFEATCVGQMTNNILPFRIGDFAQAFFIGYRENISKSIAFSTVILERLLDLTPLIVILPFSTFFILLPKEISAWRIITFGLVIFLVMFVVIKFQSAIITQIKKILPKNKFGQKLNQFIEHFYIAVSFLKNPIKIIKMLLFTFFLWFLCALGTHFCLLSFNIRIGYFSALVILCIIAISVTIPSSPGYVGTWEFFSILALSIFKVEKPLALSFTVVYHFINWLTVTLIGLVILTKSGISFAKLTQGANT